MRSGLIQVRRGTEAEWSSANPVLAAGEPGAELDTGKIKFGDGASAWAALPYAGGGTGGVASFAQYATLAGFPGTGSSSVLYAAQDSNRVYRWSGSAYVEVGDGSSGGLTAGTTGQYLRGDLTWQTLSKSAVGLSSVDNTSDVGKPISTAGLAKFAERLRRPLRSTICGIGDSLTSAEPQTGGAITGTLGSFAGVLSVQSHSRVRYAGAFGHGGYSLGQIRDEMLPLVLAQSPLPGACIVGGGTNDVTGWGGAWSVASRAAIVQDIVGQLLAAGIVPIMVAIPPRSDAYTTNVLAWNAWVRRYAAQNGLAVIDVYNAVAGSDGAFISGMTSDGTHMTGAGYVAAINKAISDGVVDLFPGGTTHVTSRSSADTVTQLWNSGGVNLGLFTADSNSDGIANGFSASGSFTSTSIVTPDPSDALSGNWQRLTRATGSTGESSLVATVSSGWTTGDRLAFSARVRTSGTATATYSVYAAGAGGIVGWNANSIDGTIYAEATAGGYCQIVIAIGATTGSGSATLNVGEVTLTNLTTNGIV